MYLCLLSRISQDLAKDLAMLAREIHDVAGEIDSVSPAATDPAIMVVNTFISTTVSLKCILSLTFIHLSDFSFISLVSVCRKMCLMMAGN